jgi:hypothetical protein
MDFIHGALSLEHLQELDPKEVTFVTDVGKVMVEFLGGRPVRELLQTGAYLEAAPYDGAFETIGRAVQAFKCVGIVSRCRPVVQGMVENWLEHQRFYDITGFDRSNLYFTTECDAKADEVQKRFGGATYFLDDGMQVLLPMNGVVRHRMLFGPQGSDQALPPGISWVDNWHEANQYMGLA